MTMAATVIVPTHSHGPTLYYSVATALSQTVTDIEVLIVGDGVEEVTREVVADLQRHDPRVRFIQFPKGPRNGEIHRHSALLQATGRIVCYLSDDDLWFPNHIATLDVLLQGDVGFAHTLPMRIEPDGRLAGWSVDLALPYYRWGILAGRNWIPMSCAGHTLEVYRRLPVGWSTTPARISATDIYMWQKLLKSGSLAVSGTQPTALVFPSPDRRGWSSEQRVEELARWRQVVADPGRRVSFVEKTLDYVARERARVFTVTPRARAVALLAQLRLLERVDRARKAAKAVFARGAR
jgi:glycosyltransferase involved in cell wall biosynthesis